MSDFPEGAIWLVGAGPGDPELLTRKAERLIRQATVVFHDALVGAGVGFAVGGAEYQQQTLRLGLGARGGQQVVKTGDVHGA